MSFELHSQLEKDTNCIGEFKLCKILLHKDNAVPWVILVPKKENLKEIHHLSNSDQHQLLKESQIICLALEHLFAPDKLNVAALGNMVSQLHVHHVARFKNDIAWPAPIWGNTQGILRDNSQQLAMLELIEGHLLSNESFKINRS